MEELFVIKIGSILDQEDQLEVFLSKLPELKSKFLLVHGGGKRATKLASQMGLETTMLEGRRVTDDAMLEVVTMTYAGAINKSLVAKLQSKGINALGMSGADGNIVSASKRPIKEGKDYGWAGDVQAVNAQSLKTLIEVGFVPTLCAITHNNQGQLLNTNADTIASEVAVALAAQYRVNLVYLFDQPGVMLDLEDPNSLIKRLDKIAYAQRKEEGSIFEGMIPKLDNAFATISKGVNNVRLGAAANFGDIANGSGQFTLIE